jgi:hypothetical protein
MSRLSRTGITDSARRAHPCRRDSDRLFRTCNQASDFRRRATVERPLHVGSQPLIIEAGYFALEWASRKVSADTSNRQKGNCVRTV